MARSIEKVAFFQGWMYISIYRNETAFFYPNANFISHNIYYLIYVLLGFEIEINCNKITNKNPENIVRTIFRFISVHRIWTSPPWKRVCIEALTWICPKFQQQCLPGKLVGLFKYFTKNVPQNWWHIAHPSAYWAVCCKMPFLSCPI